MKSKEKPIKLFKYFNKNESMKNEHKQSKDKNNDKKKEEIKNNIRNRQSPEKNPKNINNLDKETKNKKKMYIQLPNINPNSASPKDKLKNNIIKNLKVKANKSYDRVNTFTPNIKNNINIQNNESEKNYQSLKVMLGNKIKSNKKEKNNISHSNSLSLPKINVNKKIKSPSNKNLKEYNNQRNNNIQNNYNNVLNNIRKDFLLLDSIKKGTNQYEQYDSNDNLTDRYSPNKKIDYQINDQNKNNNYNSVKRIIKRNDNSNINNNIYSMNNINYYNNNNNNQNNLYNNNLYNIKNFNNIKDNYYPNNYNNIEKIQYSNNDGLFFVSQEKKKAHTSFDSPPVMQGFKKKLDIINEEDEDDNKYITDFQNINNLGNNRNLNTLEILMNQRRFYQNKMPNNSRFKLKQLIKEE